MLEPNGLSIYTVTLYVCIFVIGFWWIKESFKTKFSEKITPAFCYLYVLFCILSFMFFFFGTYITYLSLGLKILATLLCIFLGVKYEKESIEKKQIKRMTTGMLCLVMIRVITLITIVPFINNIYS